MKSKNTQERKTLFQALPPKISAKSFEFLPIKIQKELINTLPPSNVSGLLNSMSAYDRTTLLEKLPNNLVNKVLKFLSPKEKDVTVKLLGYPENK